MPWNKQDYPVSMKNLEPRVRHKAIEIANALLDDGYEEGRSIAIATAKAEEWDENHPVSEGSKAGLQVILITPTVETRNFVFPDAGIPSRFLHSKSHDNIHVVPIDSGWAIKEEGQSNHCLHFIPRPRPWMPPKK